MKKGSDSLTFLTGVFVGAVVGGVTALLVSEDSRREVKNRIEKDGKRFFTAAKKELKTINKKYGPQLKTVKDEAIEKLKEARGGFEKGFVKAKKTKGK